MVRRSSRGGRRRHVTALVVLVVLGLLGVVPGTAVADGNESSGAPLGFRAVSAGDGFTCAILAAGGSVRCWGMNQYGQLGLGDTVDRGDTPEAMGANLPAVDLGSGHSATALAAGTRHVCALLDDGGVKCWGSSSGSGALGQPTGQRIGDEPGEMGDALPPVDLPLPATAITVGDGHTCALLVDATLRCWGANSLGQLGRGDNHSPAADELHDAPPVDVGPGRTVTAVSAAGRFTCALLDDGSVKCWGEGFWGQLGNGDDGYLGTDPADMGDALAPVDLGAGRTATAISAGVAVACALLDDGSVKCWGSGLGGALGQGNTANRGDGPGEMGDALPPIALGEGRTAVSISASDTFYAANTSAHVCAVLDDGTAKCWGRNADGDLGLGDTTARGAGPGTMGDALPIVGLSSGGELRSVTTGAHHSCALFADSTLKCWGSNAHGALGLGIPTTDDRGDAAGEMGSDLPAVDLPAVGFLPTPTVHVVMMATASATRTSEPITYYVTVANEGNAVLTGVTLSDDAVPDCAGPLPDLALGVRYTVTCTYTPGVADVGTYSNTATVDTAETDAVVSNQVDVEVTVRYQPDLVVKRQGGTFAGEDVYDNAGVGQGARAGRERGGRATFVVRLGNDGDQPDVLDLRRVGPADPGLVVRYVNAANGRDLTDRIRAGTYHTRALDPGESIAIRVIISATSIARRDADHPVTLRTRSGADPTRTDAVVANLHVN